ncbi:sterol desaturase family protein [Merismopedia glauca]|uniref:Fatty acid hydroxylase n=1 Tax=Merismopedia glauca CCAP 1448/3 TaxID=1296344 RepID=A0A2T1BYA7_9CYAN|nr:sterol desaturase family protein [Merismopedia glauca]PSB01010.1 fatty acid hydroxylase [Merismopedia glauca CCAP 1448/3]
MMSESEIRLSVFLGVLLLMAVLELIIPRRKLSISKLIRWASNLGIVILNTALLRVILPLTAVKMAIISQDYNWGLFNVVSIPVWASILLSVIILDCLIYWQHVSFHKIPLFWQLHKVHHADLDFDVTTGLRFHPLEIILSMGIKILAVILLGCPPLAVVIFEVILNASSMFNHSNIYIHPPLDKFLRLWIVTPDMHRVHHSNIPSETNSNYGFNLSWWDFLFKTYRPQPELGHETMNIGLSTFASHKVAYLHWMLALPWIKQIK